MPLRARNLLGCIGWLPLDAARTTMTDMAMVYRRPVGVTRQSIKPQLASWEPVIGAFGPVLGDDPTRPFHPHDDRIVGLGLHHAIDTIVAHGMIIDAWWTGP